MLRAIVNGIGDWAEEHIFEYGSGEPWVMIKSVLFGTFVVMFLASVVCCAFGLIAAPFIAFVDVAEQADAPALGASTHGECAGSNPVIDINRRIVMVKDWKHYESNDGKLVIAYYGLSRPMNENDPFIYGYWISLDLNGSEQFIPKNEFEKEYREVRKPE